MRSHAFLLPAALALAFELFAATGCSGSAPSFYDMLPDGGGIAHHATPGDTPSGQDGGTGWEANCVSGQVPLVLSTEATRTGPLYALYVPVTYQSAPAYFQLDTGSAYTFLHEPLRGDGDSSTPEVTLDAGSIVLACHTLSLLGLPIVGSPPVQGKPCVGTFGDDRLLVSPVMLDVPGGRLLWQGPGTSFASAASWPSTSFDRPRGYIRLENVSLDGHTVRLLVDTGSPDTLWVGQQGRPGDTEVDGEDANGNVVKMYQGTASFTIGSTTETITVDRAPSFPYIQHVLDEVGGEAAGLLGLSAFRKGIVFDTEAQLVRIAPE